MKMILLLLLLAACGKHEMPPADDMGDSDGDMIPNYREVEMDKYISKVVPLQEIEAEMVFQTGSGVLSSHKILISNKIDLQKYSIDLLIKNIATLQTNDYFSEFSHMRLKPKQNITLSEPGIVRLNIKTSEIQTQPTSVFVVYPDKKVLLGDWKQNMDINIASEDLNAVLNGAANIAFTHLTGKISFFDKTKDDTIREKTYRVLLNNGSKTDIHYVSKELKFEDILRYFNIESFRNIDDVNLLTTTHKPLASEWWIRKINDRDIIIVNENLRTLSDHYLDGFAKKELKLHRQNGVSQRNLIINKNPAAKVLLKIRGNKNTVSFRVEKKKDSDNVGRDRYWVCDLYYRSASQPQGTDISGEEIGANLRINGLVPTRMQVLADEQGSFLEVEISNEQTDFELKLDNFAQNQYLPVGLYDKKCDKSGTPGPELKSNPQATEHSLSLNIEAFVEKI